MKTYISLSGFDTTQILSLIVKYGVDRDDRIILIRPEEETDERAEHTIEAVRVLSHQIDTSISLDIFRVDHRDFESMVIQLIELIKSLEGSIIANISGGPREIFLAFSIACLAHSQKIAVTTNFSDVDHVIREVELPVIQCTIDDKLKNILKDIVNNGPSLVSEVAGRMDLSESTASRQINKLMELGAVDATIEGKKKIVKATITGKVFALR